MAACWEVTSLKHSDRFGMKILASLFFLSLATDESDWPVFSFTLHPFLSPEKFSWYPLATAGLVAQSPLGCNKETS
jgi:hypothetical protein